MDLTVSDNCYIKYTDMHISCNHSELLGTCLMGWSWQAGVHLLNTMNHFTGTPSLPVNFLCSTNYITTKEIKNGPIFFFEQTQRQKHPPTSFCPLSPSLLQVDVLMKVAKHQ